MYTEKDLQSIIDWGNKIVKTIHDHRLDTTREICEAVSDITHVTVKYGHRMIRPVEWEKMNAAVKILAPLYKECLKNQ